MSPVTAWPEVDAALARWRDEFGPLRRMAFSATIPQMRAGTKTVTRRGPGTWATLTPGDRLLAIEQGMGLPKGTRQMPIGVIEIVDNRVEPLHLIDQPGEAAAEGFDHWFDFRDVWRSLHGPWEGSREVRRIAFRHLASLHHHPANHTTTEQD